MANQLDGSTYTNLVDIAKEYAAPQYADSTNNELIRDLFQTYLNQRGDHSFTKNSAQRQGRFEALIAILDERLTTPRTTPLYCQAIRSAWDDCQEFGLTAETIHFMDNALDGAGI